MVVISWNSPLGLATICFMLIRNNCIAPPWRLELALEASILPSELDGRHVAGIDEWRNRRSL